MRRLKPLTVIALLLAGTSSAWAFAVTDVATAARNAVTAALKGQILETLTAQYERLERMATRLSAHTSLDKYATSPTTQWGMSGDGVLKALREGDAAGHEFDHVARERVALPPEFAARSSSEQHAIARALATLDVADGTLRTAIHQVGILRAYGRSEDDIIRQLEADVLDPSAHQSATAVVDKLSAAALIEARQKQARLQYLTLLAEQLLVDNKRARDTEAAALNMRLGRMPGRDEGEPPSLVNGAADDLRTWRQP